VTESSAASGEPPIDRLASELPLATEQLPRASEPGAFADVKWAKELRAAILVLLVVAASGVVVGVVWRLVAPVVQLKVQSDGLYFVDPEPQAFIAADGWFAGLTLLAGGLCGGLCWRLLRGRELGATVGLALGGLLGAVVAWQVGQRLGPPNPFDAARGMAVGAVVDGPLRLGAKGFLLVWPIAAIGVFLLLELVFDRTASKEPPPNQDVWVSPGVRSEPLPPGSA
jgi:hypothetical protein